MAKQDAQRTGTHQGRQAHIGRVGNAQRLAIGDPRVAGPACQRQHHDHIHQPRAQHRHRDDGEQDGRHRQKNIHHPHHQHFDPAAQVTGQHAENHTHGAGQQGGCERHRQRHPRTMDQAREQVAAQFIAAQPVVKGA